METSSSSKVTVEYHDPAGIFGLVSHEFANRLPLRNLNWQSPSRPLRQIKTLHLDFIPDKETQEYLRSTTATTETNGSNSSLDIVRSGKDTKKDVPKERRHQIPGLKTSPYLKVYFLRCDDKESYKETQQKKVREWIRETAQNEKTRERHDASEWLIVHVVVPDTIAAGEPRWKEPSSSNDSDELKERSTGGAKWPGKSTRTVFDRLRADFNESSKTALDRIAQIRLRKGDMPPDLLPTPALATTLNETPQERENAWNDVVSKFKTLILDSFNWRVRQYEEDIAEQESRRSLPGWNFCTFFIHKEGLAKALESIGLVEDALAIYDELTLGLETVVRDIASGEAQGTATTFTSHTEDIERRILATKTPSKESQDTEDDSHGEQAMRKTLNELFNKDYRHHIVTSSISVFDFFCYLFSRQKTLVLRLANSRGARAELGALGIKDGGEDLVLLSEVCWRTSTFLHNNSRTLRQDLLRQLSKDSEDHALENVNSLVWSWTYAVAEQVLLETAGTALETASVTSQRKMSLPNGTSTRPEEFGFAMGADPYPQRMSSLTSRRRWPSQRSAPASVATLRKPHNATSNRRDSDLDIVKPAGLPGQPELATYRAELIMVQRKMLEQLACQRGWVTGWSTIEHGISKPMENISLSDDQKEDLGPKRSTNYISTLLSPLLVQQLESKASFEAEFESLSYKAMHHYVLATIIKSAEAIVADLGLLKYQQGEFEEAKSFFDYILPQHKEGGWNLMEANLLVVYSQCLRQLKKKDMYVKTVLDLLAKVCQQTMSKRLPNTWSISNFALDDDYFNVSGFLTELISYSAGLSGDVSRPMTHFFDEVHLDQEIKHQQDSDGFSLVLHFRHVLDDEILIDSASARLVSVNDPSQEIWLTSSGPVEVAAGYVGIDLESTAVAFGAFFVNKLILKANKIRFVHELQPPPEVPSLVIGDSNVSLATSTSTSRRPFVFIYPPQKAFNAEIKLSRDFHIEKHRQLEIAVQSGWNEIALIDLKLKPCTAGLRLHLADATFTNSERRNQTDHVPGQMTLGPLKSNSSANVQVPYTLDQQGPGQVISVRLEARYHTSKGDFTFYTTAKLTSDLPLDVDVNDIFHINTLFSKFNLRTTHGMPISITGAQLEASKVYEVESPPEFLTDPMLVLDQQPGKLVYKITRKAVSSDVKLNKKDAALALRLYYHPVEDMIVSRVRDQFTDDLCESEFADYTRLLIPLFSERSRQLFSNTTSRMDMALAAVVGETKTPTYQDIGWNEILPLLPSSAHVGVTGWLHKWHDSHQTLATNKLSGDTAKPRCITIAVDVPNVDFVFGMSLNLVDSGFCPAQTTYIATLGQPIKAQLRIKYTNMWSAASVLSIGTKDDQTRTTEFVYEVHADSDTWIVSGQRRAHFTTNTESDSLTVDLMLIPLKVGLCSLPHVEVQTATRDGDQADITRSSPSCETYFDSAAKVVQVIADVSLTKVQVGETQAQAIERPNTATSEA
ncbi:trafficking protein particle complex subunit 10 [Acrodontium crateriforme]|uniref:Trafficking protein particle complex subunit 10 n=1 Tax=Acrodontium crateriforme TaxID=150365 RepID=A0AAQ3RCK5_9PEZI|nr:trafficking protein particle complex subunit 10 [Acrodontium crateriforme]